MVLDGWKDKGLLRAVMMQQQSRLLSQKKRKKAAAGRGARHLPPCRPCNAAGSAAAHPPLTGLLLPLVSEAVRRPRHPLLPSAGPARPLT